MHLQPSAEDHEAPHPGPPAVIAAAGGGTSAATAATITTTILADMSTIDVTWDQVQIQDLVPAHPLAPVQSRLRMMASS